MKVQLSMEIASMTRKECMRSRCWIRLDFSAQLKYTKDNITLQNSVIMKRQNLLIHPNKTMLFCYLIRMKRPT